MNKQDIDESTLLRRINYWRKKYDLSFQFWQDQNNVYIARDLVDIHSMGGRESIEEILQDTIEWCEKTNPSFKYPNT